MTRVLVLLAACLLLLAGCSTSKDAVATGQEFQFVAPGGRTEIVYDPPASRGALRVRAKIRRLGSIDSGCRRNACASPSA